MRISALVTFLLLVGSASATAQDPPRPAQDPPARTPASCATWGARSFFSTASADTVAACIRAGADPLAPLDETGGVPLHRAARHSPHPEVIALLVRVGADVNARDLRDNTPLHGAWDNPISPLSPEPRLNRAAVEELKRQGADLLARNDRGEVADPASCEHWATPVFRRAADLMVYARCLEQGADLKTADYYGNTVLHHAAAHPDPAITTLLVRAGARTGTRNGVGASALHLAAEQEQPAVVAVLLETGAAIDARDDEGNTSLHMAAGNESVAVVEALIRAGADINALNAGGVTPLVLAIERPGSRQRGNATVANALLTAGAAVNISGPMTGSRPRSTPLLASLRERPSDSARELTLRLLARGADPNTSGALGWGPLYLAAFNDGPAMIRDLVEAGADPGLLDDSGESPLHPAASYADPGTIGELVEAGADPNTANGDGETPLHQAVARGRADNVAALLRAGADVDAITLTGDTPLHLAAEQPDTTIVSALVEVGADLNARNNEGEIPLHSAWKHDNTVAVEHLVALGADMGALDGRGRIAGPGPSCDWIELGFFGDAPDESILGCVEAGAPLDLRDSFGNLPLHRLGGAFSDVTALATALIEAGAEVNGRDDHGRTPLHAAAERDSEALASALLEGGAAVDARDTLGNTPLHEAAGRRGDADAVIVLLAGAGAEVDARNDRGATPLHLAVESGNPAAAARLLALGADRDARSDAGSVADPLSCENMNTRVFFAMASADVVAGCLDVGADVNARTEGSDSPFFRDPGSTPLHLAAEWTRDPAVIPMLLRARADLLARGPDDYTALHLAAQGGTPGTVRALIEAGAPVDVRASGPGYHIGWDWTPLHLAAARNPDPEVAAVLLAEGADLQAPGDTRQTPLHQAALNRNPAVALLLLEAGADVHARRSSGRTPLHEAARSNPNPEVIEVLLDAGADPESPFASLPPLHEAARSNPGPEVITALIEGGADVNRVIGGPGGSLLQVSDLGIRLALRGSWSPLRLAVGNNRNPAVVEALVRGGADLNSPGSRGWTALHAAASHNAAVFPILLRLGADPAVLNDEGRTPMDYAVDNQLLWGLEEVRRLRGGVHPSPAAAQDPTPPGQVPPGPTCEDWGSYNFFTLASADTVAACLRAGADAVSPVDERHATPLHHAARAALDPDVIVYLLVAGADVNARNWSGHTPLHEAARRTTNPGVITALVEGGADINARDLRDNTPLHSAWENPLAGLSREPRLNVAAVEELLRLGADPLARNDHGEVADPSSCELWNTPVFHLSADFDDFARCVETGADLAARDYYGNTVLHVAASHEDPAVAALLLEAGAELGAPNQLGDMPLHVSAALGNLAVTTLLLDAGADANTPNYQGYASTHQAARQGSPEIMAALLEGGADVNARTRVGNGPLVVAVNEGRSIALIDVLLDAGADVNARDRDGRTPLDWLFRPGGLDPPGAVRLPRGAVRRPPASTSSIVSRLLERGADPNARNDAGWTPLHQAMNTRPQEQVPTLISVLLVAGADPNARDQGGRSPLHRLTSLSGSRGGAFAMLVEAGADVNALDDNGATPLHLALMRTWGDSAHVHSLLAHGADVNARNREGDTPLHLATVRPDTTAVSALVQAGANVNARNERGETPLHWAWWRDNPVVVDKLLELGADAEAQDNRGRVPGPVCDWTGPFAFRQATVESVRGCIEAGTPVHLRAGTDWSTPLGRLRASASGRAAADMASVLLEAGADVNTLDAVGWTSLRSAASAGDTALLTVLLGAGADPDAWSPGYGTPLHSATSGSASGETATLLVRTGAEVNARTGLGATPLHWAVIRGNHEVAGRLLELGADPNALDDSGVVADPLSCEHFNSVVFFALAPADVVADCIADGAEVNARTSSFQGVTSRPRSTPLHHAAAVTRDPARLSLLVEAGAEVNVRDDRGYTPLHHAAQYGTPGMVRALLRAGALVDARALGFQIHYGWDWTPLHLAVANNPDPEVTAALLEAGANPRARGYEGETPIHLAAWNENPALAALLLEAGADANARGSTGRTPLHEAATSNSNPEVLAVLLDAGAELEARAVYPDSHWDYGNMTPLHEAARAARNPKIVTALIEAGADVNARVLPGAIPFQLAGAAGMVLPEQRGATALHIAALLNGNAAVIEALVLGGVELEHRDQFGRTALHVAAQGRGNTAAFEALLELGADPAAVDSEGRTPMDYARENTALQGPEVVIRRK